MTRNKNIFKQIKWSFVFKALAFIVYYISISYQVKILGVELYGVWATLLSIVTWVVFFDFGLGNGIKNYLTQALTKNDIKEAKEIIFTGYISVAIISIIMFLGMWITVKHINLQKIFNTNILSNNQLATIIIVLFAFVFLHFIISFVKQFIFAIQKNALNEFEQFLFYVLLMISLLFIYWKGFHSILAVVYAYGISLILSKMILTIIFFSKNRHLIPSVNNFRSSIVKKLMNVGVSFFALQLVSIFILLSDKIIVTQLLGPANVTEYDIVYRVFSIILIFHGVVNAPMWSAYTEAYMKKDKAWINKNIRKMNLLILILIIVSMLLYIFIDEIINLWIEKDIIFDSFLPLMMAIYVIVLAWCNNFAFFLNSINKIKVQFISLFIGALINIPLSIFFVKYLHMETGGVVMATILSLSIFGITGPIETRKILYGMEK